MMEKQENSCTSFIPENKIKDTEMIRIHLLFPSSGTHIECRISQSLSLKQAILMMKDHLPEAVKENQEINGSEHYFFPDGREADPDVSAFHLHLAQGTFLTVI